MFGRLAIGFANVRAGTRVLMLVLVLVLVQAARAPAYCASSTAPPPSAAPRCALCAPRARSTPAPTVRKCARRAAAAAAAARRPTARRRRRSTRTSRSSPSRPTPRTSMRSTSHCRRLFRTRIAACYSRIIQAPDFVPVLAHVHCSHTVVEFRTRIATCLLSVSSKPGPLNSYQNEHMFTVFAYAVVAGTASSGARSSSTWRRDRTPSLTQSILQIFKSSF